jgi:hypothetical protein
VKNIESKRFFKKRLNYRFGLLFVVTCNRCHVHVGHRRREVEDPIDVQQPPATRNKQWLEQTSRFGLLDYLGSVRILTHFYLQNGRDTGAVRRERNQFVLLGQPDGLRRV